MQDTRLDELLDQLGDLDDELQRLDDRAEDTALRTDAVLEDREYVQAAIKRIRG